MAFQRDGVVRLPGVLDAGEMRLVQSAFDWKLQNPGIWSGELYGTSGARFYQEKGDSSREPAFRSMLEQTRLADIAAAFFGGGPVWYLEEQLFLKEGTPAASVRRTPWHQDTSYQPMGGEKTAVFWIPLDEVIAEHSLEVVRGSHKGVIYNASKFDAADDTTPFQELADLPRLPDIQAERDKWDIVSWSCVPGDLLVFHPSALHGGGATKPGGRRRTLSLRFVGDDVTKIVFPNTMGGLSTNTGAATSTARPATHLDRYWALPLGARVSEACVTCVHRGVDTAAAFDPF